MEKIVFIICEVSMFATVFFTSHLCVIYYFEENWLLVPYLFIKSVQLRRARAGKPHVYNQSLNKLITC